MFRPRIIPVLLLKDNILVKSVKFRNHRYIGDPVNAVRLFNDLKADELLFLDITATGEATGIDMELLREITDEANMPVGAGGGFKTVRQLRQAVGAGVEKIILGAEAALRPDFVREAAEQVGSSSVSVCIDVQKNIWGKEQVYIRNGRKNIAVSPVEMAGLMQEKGAGELIVQSIAHDGMMNGYHLDLVRRISMATTIPVVALGGAGNTSHLRAGYKEGLASALAAGSLFVYHGARKGVLINYPENKAAIFS